LTIGRAIERAKVTVQWFLTNLLQQEEIMTVRVRRVVTGHDANGRAIIAFDDRPDNVISRRPGHSSCVIWTTDSMPADNSGEGDRGRKEVATTLPNGTIFRVIELAPGVSARRHRTDSTDYIAVMAGEIDMELDGSEVHLKAGDVMVQRGTIHNWINRGTEPCVIACVLVDAKPVQIGDRVLNAVG
jgi:quercetin dioxygenase-like cupin family protein